MTTVTTWTGWEANALRRALRMSVTDFAEHLGAARRTVAKWNSRGRGIQLRPQIAAAQVEDRDAAGAMLNEAARAAARLGHDGNDRWTGFGPNNVLQHRVTVALALGDAGTAIAFARQVRLDKIALTERKASLFVDVAHAYTRWGRYDSGLSVLRTAYRIAPEEIRSRPSVHRILEDLAALSRGHLRGQVLRFADDAGIGR